MQCMCLPNTVRGKILEGQIIGEWANLKQLVGKILANELVGQWKDQGK